MALTFADLLKIFARPDQPPKSVEDQAVEFLKHGNPKNSRVKTVVGNELK